MKFFYEKSICSRINVFYIRNFCRGFCGFPKFYLVDAFSDDEEYKDKNNDYLC